MAGGREMALMNRLSERGNRNLQDWKMTDKIAGVEY